MTDNELISHVAKVWVAGGGDADGLSWCFDKLKEAVNLEDREKKLRPKEGERTVDAVN